MKSIVNAESFLSALQKAFPVCTGTGSIHSLQNAQLSFTEDACTILCSNLEQWCQVTIPAQGDVFSFGFMDTKRILTVGKYYSGDLVLEYEQDPPPEKTPNARYLDGTLTFCCGARRCTQRVTAKEDMLVPPEIEDAHAYSINAAAVFQRYKRIRYALSGDDRRPVGRCVEFLDERMVTVDGYRLALNRDPSLQVEKPFFIPPEAMDMLPILGNVDCRLLVGKKHIAFEGGGIRIVSRVPEGEGLNIDAAIPRVSGEECTVDVDAFIGELQYVTLFNSKKRNRQPTCFDNGKLSLGYAPSKCSTIVELSRPMNIVIGFNEQYMIEALKQFKAKKAATVTMGMTSPHSPILLTDGEGDLAMVLPVRLKDTAQAA